MKIGTFAFLSASVVIATAMAQPSSILGGVFPFFGKATPAPARYVSEAALPEGWPLPGPYDQVVTKNYPAYRAAFTPSQRPNSGFWTLFKHIKKNGIAMSSPVEMSLTARSHDTFEMEQMGFAYPSRKIGTLGQDEANVTVRDVPACTALSYTWQGPRDEAAIIKARIAMDAALKADHRTAARYRILSYNSPFISRAKQTHEMQAILQSAK